MPANLDRCVQHVMTKGHDKSSAFAICRTSLGLSADGSQDEEAGETMPDDEMKEKADATMRRLAAAPKREDVKPSEGEAKYGDVAFADPTNKKYPIDTEEHIRAAWNYINKAANAAKYPDRGAAIKKRIVAAWKSKIDKDGPPSASVNASALPSMSSFSLRKDVIVAHAGRKFRNGETVFDMTEADLDQMVENFKALGNQVPVFLGFHVESGAQKAGTPADGWVEGLKRVGGDLVASIKLNGAAAQAVLGDQFRGVSIGVKTDGRDRKGKDVGPVLDHLAIVNDAFFGDLNIAAASIPAGQEAILNLVSRWERPMPKPAVLLEDPDPGAPGLDEVSDPKALTLIKERDEAILKLKAESMNQQEQIDTLKAQVEASRANPDLSEAMVEIERLKRKDHARDIISLVDEGLYVRHNLKPAWTKGYKPEKAGADALETAIQWLKASRFAGDIKLLRYQVENGDPIAEIGKTYPSGKPKEETITLSRDDQETIRKHGGDPERIIALKQVTNLDEYRALVARAKEK